MGLKMQLQSRPLATFRPLDPKPLAPDRGELSSVLHFAQEVPACKRNKIIGYVSSHRTSKLLIHNP